MKYRKSSGNRGFTLIELIVGVVILGIVIVPLLHVFVTGARTAQKSRQYDNATIAARNVVEKIQGTNIDELLENPHLIDSSAKFYNESFSTPKTAPTEIQITDEDGDVTDTYLEYYLGTPVSSGNNNYYAKITLSTISAENDKSISIGNFMDAPFNMVGTDERALDEYNDKWARAQELEYYSHEENVGTQFTAQKCSLSDLSREITISAIEASENSSTYNITVEFTYYRGSSPILDSYTVSAEKTLSVDNVAPPEYGTSAFSVYLFYNANITKSPHRINISNPYSDVMDFNVFLANCGDSSVADRTSVYYKSQRFDGNTTDPQTNTRVFANLTNITYYAYTPLQWYTTSNEIDGQLVETRPIDRVYSINVKLYSDGTSTEVIAELDAETLT